MNGENLIKQMKTDIVSGLTPAFVVATLGTTGLCVGLFTQIELSGKETSLEVLLPFSLTNPFYVHLMIYIVSRRMFVNSNLKSDSRFGFMLMLPMVVLSFGWKKSATS